MSIPSRRGPAIRIAAASRPGHRPSAVTAQDIARRVGQAVDGIIRRRGMTRAEFARVFGRDASNVTRLLAGRYPPAAATLADIANALGVDPAELLRRPEA